MFQNPSFRRTFILPTKTGMYFALGDLVILALAFIYSNNAIYFLCFFIFSMGLITMVITNFNLARIRINKIEGRSFFADEKGKIYIELMNPSRSSVYALQMRFRGSTQFVEINKIEGRDCVLVEVPLELGNRGMQNLPILILETQFPFCFFRSWKLMRPEEPLLIYPARLGIRQLPATLGDQGGEPMKEQEKKYVSEEVFAGHRNYSHSDSFRRIDWKAYARTQALLVKQYESEESGEDAENVILNWNHTGHLKNLEARISQMTVWMEICHQRRGKFQLELPGWKSPLSRGDGHYREILEKLSLLPAEINHD